MSDKKRKIVVYLTLPLALIWAFYSLQTNSNDYDNTGVAQEASAVIQQATYAPVAGNQEVPLDIDARDNAPWGSDPFRTYLYRLEPGAPLERQIEWVLKGIVYSPTSPQAFVNGSRVKVGDTIDRAKVLQINRRTVVLEHQGKKITLSVNKG